jgi:hypothetical protein
MTKAKNSTLMKMFSQRFILDLSFEFIKNSFSFMKLRIFTKNIFMRFRKLARLVTAKFFRRESKSELKLWVTFKRVVELVNTVNIHLEGLAYLT